MLSDDGDDGGEFGDDRHDSSGVPEDALEGDFFGEDVE